MRRPSAFAFLAVVLLATARIVAQEPVEQPAPAPTEDPAKPPAAESTRGDLRAYDNRGSFGLTRDDYRAFFDVRLGSEYSLQVAYRDLEYVEDAYDAYEAEILELAFGLRW